MALFQGSEEANARARGEEVHLETEKAHVAGERFGRRRGLGMGRRRQRRRLRR